MREEINESDWKMLRKKLPDWQESFMEHLCDEYKEILDTDANASDRFWELFERLKHDRGYTGVSCEMRRSNMIPILIQLLEEKAITHEELADFSPELQERLSHISPAK